MPLPSDAGEPCWQLPTQALRLRHDDEVCAWARAFPARRQEIALPTFGFTASVTGLTNEPDQLTRLFTEKMTLVPSETDGAFSITAYVDASSSEDAVHALDCHLQEATPEISMQRIDEDLVTATEISVRLGNVTRETVRLWSQGKRRAGFPAHRLILSGGTKLWVWADVHAWLEASGLVDTNEPRPLATDCVDWYNGHLVTRRREPLVAKTEFAPDWEVGGSIKSFAVAWAGIKPSTHLLKGGWLEPIQIGR